MGWISVKDTAAPKEPILVLGLPCRMPHVAIYDYGEHVHTECCYDQGGHFPGSSIEFEYWMPLPTPPK